MSKDENQQNTSLKQIKYTLIVSEWEELQAMEEESGLNLIKLPCLRTSICEMDLGSNPRSLSHICRIVIYSAMGNRLSAVEDFLPHNMKEYLHTFCYY